MQSPPIQILTILGTDPIEILSSGGVIRALVESGEGGLSLAIGPVRVPIPQNSELQAGQRVSVELVKTGQGSELHVRPLQTERGGAATAVSAGAKASAPVGNLFTALLQVLSNNLAGPIRSDLASQVRLLNALFMNSAKDSDLHQVVSIVETASMAGVKVGDLLGPLQVLVTFLCGDSVDFEKILKSSGDRAGRSLESQIALALQSGNLDSLEAFLQGDVRSILLRLYADKTLGDFLQRNGQLRQFQEHVSGLIDRLSAENLQNLRGLEHAYRFFEVPFAPALGFERAQIHIYGEPGKQAAVRDADGATVAFDLSMSNLGNLWIDLHVLRKTCTCRFLAPSPAVESLRDASAELAASLQSAGFTHSRVEIEPWDGNRVKQLSHLLRRHAPLDVSI